MERRADVDEFEITKTIEKFNNDPKSEFSYKTLCFLLAEIVSQCEIS